MDGSKKSMSDESLLESMLTILNTRAIPLPAKPLIHIQNNNRLI
jgi:hypothetical protein